jgi:septal ring-binding cell division protein DamX
MNVPYTVMPVNELEYGVTAGVLQDSTHGKYGKGEFYYGLSRKLTIGGGLEYLSSITDGKVMPFAKATLQPFSKLTLNAEYVHGVRSRGLINYYFSRDILLEIDYANYVDGQRATLFNASEELKAKLSIPYRMHQLNGYLKIDYSQLKYASFDFNYAYVMLSANYKQWNANSALQLNWIDQQNPYMTNDLALSYRLNKNIIMRPSIKYNGSDGRLISYKTEIEKSSYLGHFGVSYEKNKLANNHFINLSFKYDLSFARVSTVATISKANFTTSESAQGSVAFDRETNYVHTSKNTSNGKGGLLLYPFLDINQNGIFDKDEKLVKLSAVTISGGKALFSEKDSIIRIPDLNAFTNYNLSFSDTDLDNIAWRFKHKTYQVLIDPNQFKRIDIPIHIVGEMSGMVYKEHQNTLIGIARILVKIYQKNNNQLVAETLSEPDGYSYFLGLKPGDYKACIDADQLSNLNLIATPDCRYFTIKSMLEGDIVSGLDFNLSNKKTGTPINKDTIPTDDQMVKPKVSPSQEEIKAKLSNRNDEAKILYVLQLMASRKSVDINDYFSKLRNKIPSLQITETHQKNGWYRYNAGIYSTRTEAVQMARKIKDSGWKDCFVAPIISVDQIDQDPPVEVSTQQNITDKKVDSPSKMSEIEINKPVDSFSNNYKPWYALNTYRKEQGEIVYVLQLMASRSPVNINTYFSKILAKIPTLEIAETHQKDGWVRYHVGIYKTPQEAMTKVHQLKASGWKEFFIAPYITIQQPHFNK